MKRLALAALLLAALGCSHRRLAVTPPASEGLLSLTVEVFGME